MVHVNRKSGTSRTTTDNKMWRVDNPLVATRASARMRAPKQTNSFKNVNEFCLIAYRLVKGPEKGKYVQHVQHKLDQINKYYPTKDHGMLFC